MDAPGSITRWLGQLKAGDRLAVQPLWERYFRRLVGLARKRLEGAPRRAADEEDVASSAFGSFCRRAEQGLFPKLDGRGDLWTVLVLLTARKVITLRKYEGRKKRGGGVVFSDLAPAGDSDAAVDEVVGAEPTPEFAAQVAEEYHRLLAALPDDELRSVAVWKMEGYTNDEIAGRLNCVTRTVERKLRVIRSVWEKGTES